MKVYKLKITLEGVEPEVWREVQVIENIEVISKMITGKDIVLENE